MNTLAFFLLLFFYCSIVQGQNIFSALHLNEERDYKTVKPKKIVETSISYNKNGKHSEKNIKKFDEAGMLLIEERFDKNGDLESRLTYTNDTLNRLNLSRIFESWNKFGYRKESAYYTYDSNKFLTGITDKDANGVIFMQSDIVCNEKGNPVELTLFNGNGNLYGKEIASYLYDKNHVITSVISDQGEVISTDTIKISFTKAYLVPEGKETYNSHGDLISWVRVNHDGTETAFEEEYTYDQLGNCTENKIYKISIRKNGERKKEVDKIIKKEYTY